MAELARTSPGQGLVPVRSGDIALTEFDPAPVTAIMPYAGADMDGALDGRDLAWPAPGRVSTAAGARAVWAGLDTVYLLGAAADAGLSDRAALVELSDAFVWLSVEAPEVAIEQVMARLTPLAARDLPPGTSARSLVGHMHGLLIRPGAARLEIAVYRSMAGTLVHEVERAARIVSTRISHGL